MIIDCKSIAKSIYTDIEEEVLSRDSRSAVPTLGVILVGENSPSMRYINQKRKFCEKVGMGFVLKEFPLSATQDEILKTIEDWNKESEISSYIVQLPLPDHMTEMEIIDHIIPSKDADGFHPMNKGKVLIGDRSAFVPCTPAGVMKILETEFESLEGKQAVVIGKSNLVGKPLVALLMNQGATVVSCNSKTPDISYYTKKADIVVCAAGVPGLLKVDMIGEHTVVIDVGFTVVDGKIHGDALTNEINDAGNAITSVPGGVGTLTVAMLLSNTLEAWKNQNNI